VETLGPVRALSESDFLIGGCVTKFTIFETTPLFPSRAEFLITSFQAPENRAFSDTKAILALTTRFLFPVLRTCCDDTQGLADFIIAFLTREKLFFNLLRFCMFLVVCLSKFSVLCLHPLFVNMFSINNLLLSDIFLSFFGSVLGPRGFSAGKTCEV